MSHMLSSSGTILGTKIVSILLLVSHRVNVLTHAGSWDTPPQPGEFGYQSFQNALMRFLTSRNVLIPRRKKQDAKAFDDREKGGCVVAVKGTPDLGQNSELKLMPFQVCVSWYALRTFDSKHFIRLRG